MSDRSLQIEELYNALPTDLLWGAFRLQETQGTRLVLVGWVLGIEQEVGSVQILSGGTVVASTSPSLPRSDIPQQFPDRGAAATCGFELGLEAKGKGQSILTVAAVLEDGTAAPMGEVRASVPTRRWADVLRRN